MHNAFQLSLNVKFYHPKTSLNKAVISLCLLFAFQSAAAQHSSKQIDSIVNDAMSKFVMAGASIGVVKDGEIIHCKGYGITSVKTKKKVNEHTNFGIASNSKAFTATALAMLVEEGKISWITKVRSIIPEFKMYNAYVTENFTVEDLLSHRSGMGLGECDLMWFPDGSDFKMEDMVTAFKDVEPESGFRTELQYNNILFFIAGEVIARVSGMSWEDFITNRIFSPLGMDKSVASISRIESEKNLAKPHTSAGRTLQEFNSFSPQINGAAAGIYANVDDLCLWMLANLNQGTNKKGKQIFSNKSQKQLWKLHTVTDASRSPRNNQHFNGYGLGWFLGDINGNMTVSHTGGLPGMLSKTIMLPDLDLGIVILTNTSDDGGAFFSAVSNTLVDAYVGLEDYGWVDKYANYFVKNQEYADSVLRAVWKETENVGSVCLDIKNIVGNYTDDWFGGVTIEEDGDKVVLKSKRSPKLSGPLTYYKANTYLVKWDYQNMNADAYIIFSLDETGKGTGFLVKGISPNIDFSFDFEDLEFTRENPIKH